MQLSEDKIERSILKMLAISPAETIEIADTFRMTIEEALVILEDLKNAGWVQVVMVYDKELWALTEAAKSKGRKLVLKPGPVLDPSTLDLKIGDVKSFRERRAALAQSSGQGAASPVKISTEMEMEFADWLAAVDEAEEQWTMDCNAPINSSPPPKTKKGF
jgi:hypothetical protein